MDSDKEDVIMSTEEMIIKNLPQGHLHLEPLQLVDKARDQMASLIWRQVTWWKLMVIIGTMIMIMVIVR